MKKNDLRQVFIFLALTLFLSFFVFWGPIALLKIPTVNLVDGKPGPIWAIILFILGGFVPSILSIILTAIYEGKTGIKELIVCTFRMVKIKKSLLMILMVMVVYGLSLSILYQVVGGQFDYKIFYILLPQLIPLFILGPLSEELGWRGFAIKRLLKYYHPVITSLIIGLVWSLWHLPLFHMVGTIQFNYHLPFLVFAITNTFLSFAFTYFYIQTKGSIFSAVYFHWLLTYILTVISTNVDRNNIRFNNLEFIPSLIIGTIFIILLIRKHNLNKKGS